MQTVFKKGKARSIGVSNWTISELEHLLAVAEIKPVVNQIEVHPYFSNTEVVEYCLSKDILLVGDFATLIKIRVQAHTLTGRLLTSRISACHSWH